MSIWHVLDEQEESSVEYELTHLSNGTYTTEVEIPNEGLYYAQASVLIDDQKAMPRKYFAVGRLSQTEVMVLSDHDLEQTDSDAHEHH